MKTSVSSKLFLMLNFVSMMNSSDQIATREEFTLEYVSEIIDNAKNWIMPYFTAGFETCTKKGNKTVKMRHRLGVTEDYPIWSLPHGIEVEAYSDDYSSRTVVDVTANRYTIRFNYDFNNKFSFYKYGYCPQLESFANTPIVSLLHVFGKEIEQRRTVTKQYFDDQIMSFAQANELLRQRQANEQTRQLEQARELERQQQDELLKRNHVEVILTTNSCWC